MQKFPAHLGWQWVKEGFALFRKQPAELSTLFLAYIFVMFILGRIPMLGQLLQLLLIPAFSMAFMQACAHTEQGEKVYPSLLLTGFRSPAFISLLKLGGLYVMAALVAMAGASLVDGGVFFKVMAGQITLDPETLKRSDISVGRLMLAMLFAAAVYISAAMAFWYAAPLIAWKKMRLGQAIFYSFFSVYRAGKAFVVYGLSWVAVGVLLPMFFSRFILLLTGSRELTVMILFPLSIVVTLILYCSFYPTYTHVFGKPNAPEEAGPDAIEE